MQLYDPTVTGPDRHYKRAGALASLDGKTIGILENGKLNAENMLREVALLFEARHGCKIAPLYSKANASAPAPEGVLEAAAKEVDFLITGLGDWGSCSTCSLHDGISFEQLGKRAVVVCTEPFEVTARNIARMLGVPDYPFVMVEHPIGSRTLPELKERALVAYDQALTILCA